MDEPDSLRPALQESLFEGDTGILSAPARGALIRLLVGPYLEKERKPEFWIALLTWREAIESRMHELFLELVIDEEIGIAFARQVAQQEREVDALLRQKSLKFLESVLALQLRGVLAMAIARGERCVVSRTDMVTWLKPYKHTESIDEVGYLKRCNGAIKYLVDRHFLRKMRSSEERFEVTSSLKILFSVEQIEALTEQYRQIRDGEIAKPIERDDEENES